MATSCIAAQAVENQIEVDNRLHHSIKKRQNDCSCIPPPIPGSTCGNAPCITLYGAPGIGYNSHYNLTGLTFGDNCSIAVYDSIPIIGVAPGDLFRYSLSNCLILDDGCVANLTNLYPTDNCVSIGPLLRPDFNLGGIRVDGNCNATGGAYNFDNIHFNEGCNCYVCSGVLAVDVDCKCYVCENGK